MAGEKFYFVFDDEPNKRVQTQEPIGYGEVDFNFDQRENGMGRDVSLSGGKVNFKFTLYRHGKAFDKILYYAHFYGFESDVKLIIVLEDGTEFIGELDFVMATTNDFNYFDCPVIMESETQVFRRRAETKVDLFSSVDIDGNAITPLTPVNMLLLSKPALQTSNWKQASESTIKASHLGEYINITQSIESSEILDTLNPFSSNSTDRNDFKILTAKTKLKNVKLNIKNIDISISGGTTKVARIFLLRGVALPAITGSTFENANILHYESSSSDININTSLPEFVIGDVGQEENLWLFLLVTQVLANEITTVVRKVDVSITAESTAYNSIVPCIQVIDALKQIAKSTAGLEINSPRYEPGGDLYGTVITNGKLLGGNTTDPFYVSWDDIMQKSIAPEVNADSEIQIDKRVFVGIERDYYTGDECGFFNNIQFSAMSRKPNPKYCLNSFGFKYKNYQSLKENTKLKFRKYNSRRIYFYAIQ